MGRVAAFIAAGAAAVLVLIGAATAGVVSAMFGGGGYGFECEAPVTAPGAVPVGLTAQQASATVVAYTGGTLPTCDGGPVAPSGWARPVAGTVGSGFRTGDRPGHDGVDIMAPRGTVIRAASSGVVVRVRCNVGGGSWDAPFDPPMPCDVDGSPTTDGCGWYAEVRHAADVVTRYCHMVRQPIVRVGQAVAAGQHIGYVGSSGNSSGPHLHFEVHEGYPAHEGNATDPVSFMAQKGVRL